MRATTRTRFWRRGYRTPWGQRKWLADAVHAAFSGDQPLADALRAYAQRRDATFQPMYRLTCDMARLAPPSEEIMALYQALRDNTAERNNSFGALGGTVSIPAYFAPEHLQNVIAGTKTDACH